MKRSQLALIFVLIFFLIACQPSPKSDYIVSKESDILSQRITASPISQHYEYSVPTEWNERIQFNNFLCNIDAKIQKPVFDSFPVWQIESDSIKSSFVQQFLDEYASPISHVYLTTITRKDLEEQLKAALRGAVMVNELDGTIYYEPFDEQQEMIDSIADQLKHFDEQIVLDSSNLIDNSLPNQFSVETETGCRWAFSLHDQLFCARAFGDNEILQPESWIISGNAIPGEKKGTMIENVLITEGDAIVKANEVLDQFSIKNMGIVSVENARTINAFSYEQTSVGWVVEFRRSDNNSIPVDFLSYSFVEALVLEDDRYSMPWFAESLSMYITDSGLKMLEWKNPKKIIRIVNRNVELLPFSEIQDNAKKMIISGTKWTEESSFQTEITITNVFMTYGAIRPKNTNEYRYLLPIWVIEYLYNRSPGEVCFFAINAVDGTRAEVVTIKLPVPE